MVKERVDAAAEEAVEQSAELRSAISSLEQQYDWSRGGQTPKTGVEGADDASTAPTVGDSDDDTDELAVGGDMFADLDNFLREQREPPPGNR